ncbi:MAG TPA: sensor histidine kinase [Thermaerobacter sp.]
MNPWRLDDGIDRWEWRFHGSRFALLAGAIAAWLLEERPPPVTGAGVAVGLSLVILLDLVAQARPRGRRATGLVLLQVVLVMVILHVTASQPLAGVLAALILGVPRALPPAWPRGLVLVVPPLAGLVLWARAGLAAAAYTAAGLGAAAWVALWLEEWESERQRHREMVAELERAQAHLVELAARARDLAAEKERQRLLGEIHDTIGHSLTATLLQVQVARRQLAADPGAAAQRLAGIEASLRTALAEVRRALRHAQQPEALPLASALQVLAEDMTRAGGPQVEVQLIPDPVTVSDLSPRVAVVLYRAVQEALTNAVRHGGARTVRVRAEAIAERLRLTISDDGAGAAHLVPGLGLQSMAARVQEIGGSLRFDTAPGRGFTVEIGVRRR